MICLLHRFAAKKMFKAHLNYTKADGSTGTVDGKPVIVDNAANGLATLVQEDDAGLDLLLTIGETVPEENAESNFNVNADVDLGDGVKLLPYEIRIIWVSEVVGVEATFKEVIE